MSFECFVLVLLHIVVLTNLMFILVNSVIKTIRQYNAYLCI